jgi:UDP-N-acetylmuramoyl-tripeptide--D-alanyl-D-alanine ligase
MGANHEGEIRFLCSIASPDYGIITNIGIAHLEGFGSPEGVKRGKGELYDSLKQTKGRAFYNHDNPVLRGLIEDKQVISSAYGNTPGSLCNGKIIERSRFLKVHLSFKDDSEITVQTNLVGDYNLENIIAASAIGNFFDVPADEIKSAIENYIPSNSRSQFITTEKNRIVLDAYNANPSSMDKSVRNFLELDDAREKIVILGDMLELGEYSEAEHLKIIGLLKEYRLKNAFLVGEAFSRIKDKEYKYFLNVDELIDFIESHRPENKLILLKGSRGTRLEKVLPML